MASATMPTSPSSLDGLPVTPASTTIGQYIIDRLHALGVDHVFGIPGDYILTLYKMLEESPIQLVGMTREDSAGFAADAYARIKGLGCVCVTYCVGGLSTCNSVAGAYAEKSPVVVLSGSPGMSERDRNPLLHHKVKDFSTQFEVYEKITVASAVLDDPLTAFSEIDRVLAAAVRYKRPVYLEVPRDLVLAQPVIPHRAPGPLPPSDPDALREAIEEASALLTAAKRPMILADVEIHRFGLQDDLIALAEGAGLPIASTILGKSVIPEGHPLFVGVYEGAMGRAEVAECVEEADCLLMLGCFLTDINLGIFTAKLDPSKCIDATSEDLRIRFHHYKEVRLDDFIKGLTAKKLSLAKPLVPPKESTSLTPWVAEPDTPMTSARLFARLDRMLGEDMVVIADIGDSLFGSADLHMTRRTEFISPAYYTSMGFAVPAAVGAGMANRDHRALVIVGDGAFQMTGMELSTIARNGLNPIVVVLNNHGYTTERFILEGSFNDVHEWKFHKIPEVLGTGLGIEVRTEAELDAALKAAIANTSSFSLINVHLDPMDRSPALERLATKLANRL
jgi:indolepyruvate decarboxylase